MRILHLIEAHSVHTQRIAGHQRQAGHDVTVVTFRNQTDEQSVVEIPRRGLAARLPYHHHWQGMVAAVRAIHAFDPHVVHAHYLSTAGLYLLGAFGRPVVGSAMGSDVLVDPQAAHARFIIRSLPRWVDRFTSVAPHVTGRMTELGIPAERINTFPWGVDPVLFHPASTASSPGVIISTRNFEPVYDLPTVLDAMARVRRKAPAARLWLFGDGSQRVQLRRRADQSGIAPSVTFAGTVRHKDLPDKLRESSVYVSAATSDGASVSLFEAMATGVVPVVSDTDANRVWIDGGRNGLLFTPRNPEALAEALYHALTDDELRARCRELNPTIVSQRASWAFSMRELDRVYERVLA